MLTHIDMDNSNKTFCLPNENLLFSSPIVATSSSHWNMLQTSFSITLCCYFLSLVAPTAEGSKTSRVSLLYKLLLHIYCMRQVKYLLTIVDLTGLLGYQGQQR